MSEDLHDLRVGDLVLREMGMGDSMERHIGEVIAIRARVRYPSPTCDWGEWWDVTTGSLWPFDPCSAPDHRLRRALIDQSVR